MERPRRDQRSEKKFQAMLILVYEVVIVQPAKTHFLTFSSETKIMKITHSALLGITCWFDQVILHGIVMRTYLIVVYFFTNYLIKELNSDF